MKLIKNKCQHCIKEVAFLGKLGEKRFCEFHLEEHREKKGREWADILLLRADTEYNKERGIKSREHKDFRYKTQGGNKTALGIFYTIVRLNGEKGEDNIYSKFHQPKKDGAECLN